MKSIFIFFKEKIFDFDKFFTWPYLTVSPSVNTRYLYVYFGFFALCVIAGIVLAIYLSRTRQPKFYKRFLYWVDSFLIYIPLALVLHLLLRLGGIEPFNNRLTGLVIVSIWLIWFLFLLYYLIVRLPKYFGLYVEEKRREKYFKNGSKR